MEKTFSYSQLSTFRSCPQKYKINYIDRIFSESESIEAFMGKRVHEVLEWFYLQKGLNEKYIVFDKLVSKYEEFWLEKWHDSIFIALCKYDKHNYNKSSVYKIGLLCLRNYYIDFSSNGYFKSKILGAEVQFELSIKDYRFRGVIDRIDKNSDGSIEIIDYKTSKKSKTNRQAKNDLQLAIYLLACKKMYKDASEFYLNLYFLRNRDYVRIKHDSDQIKKIENNIIKNVENIEKESDFYAKESILCEWCYNWKECEVKSSLNPAIKI